MPTPPLPERPVPTVAAVLAALEAAGVPDRAGFSAGYAPSAMRHLGVPVPALRAVLKPVIGVLRKGPGLAVPLAFALHGSGVFEGRQAGFEILAALPKVRRGLGRAEVVALAEGNDNWCSVDTYATCLSGPAWREGTLPDEQIATWSASADRWLRRTALVSTVALNMKSRGGVGDTPRTLAVCQRHVADGDDMVAKGLSWALRELAERDPTAVSAFLAERRVPARVLREVRSKLETGRKARPRC